MKSPTSASTLRNQGSARIAVLICLLEMSFALPSPCSAQTVRKPLSKQEVIDLLTADLPSSQVEAAVRQFGISFRVTSAAEGELKDAGATDSLIKTLRELAPKTPSKPEGESPPSPPAVAPPMLMIQSKPGGAEVYVDDEPLATTSPEGRLKLTQLAPGQHIVRVALPGYRDFERQVTLTNGQTTNLEADLQAAQPEPPTSKPVGGVPTGNKTVPGTLGLFVHKGPPGQRGLVVIAVVPGGPAEEAGLLPGFVVHSVAGHEVAAAPDVVEALSGHGTGDAVEVVYTNGVRSLTARPVLGPMTILTSLPRFRVVHDHGPPAPNYCMGEMLIVGRTVLYFGRQAVSPSGPSGELHEFNFQASQIAEVRKNGVYMAAQGAFHIRTKNGLNANFLHLGEGGKYLPPAPVLSAIESAFAAR